MAKFSLRRFEDQAQLSLITSSLSVLTFSGMAAALAFFLKRGLAANEWVIYYGQRGRMAILLAAAITILLAATGFGFGLSSAGQRRNDKQQLSWIGFFIGAIVLAMTFVALFVFVQRGEMVVR